MEAVDQLLVRPVGRVGRVLLGDDQPGAARGPRRVVGRVLLGGQAVLRVVREVRGEHDAVAHDDRPDAQRREQVAVPAHVAPDADAARDARRALELERGAAPFEDRFVDRPRRDGVAGSRQPLARRPPETVVGQAGSPRRRARRRCSSRGSPVKRSSSWIAVGVTRRSSDRFSTTTPALSSRTLAGARSPLRDSSLPAIRSGVTRCTSRPCAAQRARRRRCRSARRSDPRPRPRPSGRAAPASTAAAVRTVASPSTS